jgi:hypothetical protein
MVGTCIEIIIPKECIKDILYYNVIFIIYLREIIEGEVLFFFVLVVRELILLE